MHQEFRKRSIKQKLSMMSFGDILIRSIRKIWEGTRKHFYTAGLSCYTDIRNDDAYIFTYPKPIIPLEGFYMGDHICPWWFAYTFDNPFRRFFHNPEKMFDSYVSRGMTVLDVGCGMGFFSIGLARLVGDRGCVIAADVQPKMLGVMQKRSEKAGVSNIIRLHRSEPSNLGVDTPVDFILAFWMVHEVPDPKSFFDQIGACLKTDGRILIAEPRFHVSSKRFQETVVLAQVSGLKFCETPSIKFSRSAVLKNDSS